MSKKKQPPRVTPAFLHILLCLAEGDKHGYAVMQEVAERSRGGVKLGPGSLYWSFGRLEEAGWIEESSSPRAPQDDERRRYYRLTPQGRKCLQEELITLDGIMALARKKNLLPERG